uniref:Uncharacterized protein n=1 Tax=Solanum tuberosum TaxID=4113 RepID=M1DDS7_SOLTU
MCKQEGVPLLDTDEVLPMDPHFHPLLVRKGSTSRSKQRRTNQASSNQAAVEADDDEGDDSAGGDARPSQSQPPLSGVHVEEDLAAVRRQLGHSFSSTTPVPPSTALEVEMLHHELGQEMKNGRDRDTFMVRMWKTLKVVFSCVVPGQELPRVEAGDFRHGRGHDWPGTPRGPRLR